MAQLHLLDTGRMPRIFLTFDDDRTIRGTTQPRCVPCFVEHEYAWAECALLPPDLTGLSFALVAADAPVTYSPALIIPGRVTAQPIPDSIPLGLLDHAGYWPDHPTIHRPLTWASMTWSEGLRRHSAAFRLFEDEIWPDCLAVLTRSYDLEGWWPESV